MCLPQVTQVVIQVTRQIIGRGGLDKFPVEIVAETHHMIALQKCQFSQGQRAASESVSAQPGMT